MTAEPSRARAWETRTCSAFLALLAGDLRTVCGTARLVAELWPDGRPDNPAKASQPVDHQHATSGRHHAGSELQR
jgi:hypothetical protein